MNRVRPEIWSSPKWGTFVREPLVRVPKRYVAVVCAVPFSGYESRKLHAMRAWFLNPQPRPGMI